MQFHHASFNVLPIMIPLSKIARVWKAVQAVVLVITGTVLSRFV